MKNETAFGKLKYININNFRYSDKSHILYTYDGKNINKYSFKQVFEYDEGKENYLNILEDLVKEDNDFKNDKKQYIILKTCSYSNICTNYRKMYIFKKI